jgi:hypothetical protein
MRKILLALIAATVMAGTAIAREQLADQQMDKVAAGFEAFSGPTPADLQELAPIVAAVTATLGNHPPLVSRDNFPPSALTQPGGQSSLPASQFFGFTVNPGGPCICSLP